MTAEKLAKNALMEFLENKTRDFYSEQEWIFYRDLLEYAKNYRPDFSGYIPPEYKAVNEVCKKFDTQEKRGPEWVKL
ncbi:hypothetical protein AGMMS49944_08880 [Spirochaetia bacterium]|nr:hypothetical protein AGMMS49944_08880 [Spirochaetia bacterium]